MSQPEAAAEHAASDIIVETDVAIIGAGFAGLGMAMRLKRDGNDDFVILERNDEVGGTWHVNTYPGCGCDVPSHLYSFSFAPNPDWSNTYSRQPEIKGYLVRLSERLGITPHIRFGHEVAEARYDEDAARWVISTRHGLVHARALIAALGPLTEPRIPDLPGVERFKGPVFHSARWDHDQDLTGKRVVSIGTGASAIQYVPALQPHVEQLDVFQRTPPWIVPHRGRAISERKRRLYRAFPLLQRIVRGGVYVGRETLVPGFTKRPSLMRLPERVARRHLAQQVPDPKLRERLTPDYLLGCKRILPSNDWYPALTQPNVDVVTSGIREVRERSVVDGDGNEREADAIVLGTGFEVADIPGARHIYGRDGVLLADAWSGSPHAYLGSAIAGFPNLFFLTGPNTGLGHGSMVYMIESQIQFVRAALRLMRERGADTIEVRKEAEIAYNRELDRRMRSTVWSSGCASWYIDPTGRNSTLWPSWTWEFRRRASRIEEAHFELGRNGFRAPGSERRAQAAGAAA